MHKIGSNQYVKVGRALGSNPGGQYTKDGKSYYVKFPNGRGQNLTEEMADAIHEALGVNTMGHKAIDIDGQEASVSNWKPDMQILGKAGWGKLSPEQADQAAKIVLGSILTKNWDVVGLEYDNVAQDKQGKLYIVDTGGAFTHRAQGDPRVFDGSAQTEITRMFDPTGVAGKVLKPLRDKHPEAFRKAAAQVAKLTPGDFKRMTSKLNDGATVEALVERQRVIVKEFQ